MCRKVSAQSNNHTESEIEVINNFVLVHAHTMTATNDTICVTHQSWTFWLYKTTGTQKLKMGKMFVDLSEIWKPMVKSSSSMTSQPTTTLLTNIPCNLKPSRRSTWHSADGAYHNQTDSPILRTDMGNFSFQYQFAYLYFPIRRCP